MTAEVNYTPEEMMTIAAARKFRSGVVCFIGVGMPSLAAGVAQKLHAPDVTLVYESGAIGSRPGVAPLSIADPQLADTALFLASVPEIFTYWLQGGRIDVGFLGAAQVDRFANINSTVIGSYESPKVRMPGAGGAPHITANVREIVIIVRHSTRVFVERLDFLTTPHCKGTTTVITDLGILETSTTSGELYLTSHHPGVTVEQILKATGWPLKVAASLKQTEAPTTHEIASLRELKIRTQRAHDVQVQYS